MVSLTIPQSCLVKTKRVKFRYNVGKSTPPRLRSTASPETPKASRSPDGFGEAAQPRNTGSSPGRRGRGRRPGRVRWALFAVALVG